MIAKSKIPIGFQQGQMLGVVPSQLPEGTSDAMMGMWEYKHYLRKVPGETYLDGGNTAPVSSPGLPVVLMVPYYKNEVFQYYLVGVVRTGGGNSIYKLSSAGVWTLLTTGTFSLNQSIRTYQHGDNLWIATESQVLGYWNGSTFTTPTDYASHYAKDITVFYNHMLLANVTIGTTNYPHRVKWSVFGDTTDLSGTTSGYMDLDYTSGEILGMGKILDRLFVFKKDSIWEVLYVGGDTVFSAQQVVDNVGCLATESIQSYPVVKGGGNALSGSANIYFLGTNNVYAFDGRNLEPIGEPVRELLYGIGTKTSPEYLKLTKALINPSQDEYWLAAPWGASYPNRIYVFKTKQNSWWPSIFANVVHSMMYGKGSQSVSWEDMTLTWAVEIRTWDDSGLVTYVEDLLVGSQAQVIRKDYNQVDNLGVDTEAYWESKIYTVDWNVRWLQLALEARGITGLELLYSLDDGESWTSLGSQLPTSDTVWDKLQWTFDTTTKSMKFKLLFGSGSVECQNIKATATVRKGDR